MTAPEIQVVAQIFTERLLNAAVEGVLLAGMVWLLLRAFGHQDSRTRFAIWLSALAAMVALPFLSGWELRNIPSGVLSSVSQRGGITLSSSWAYFLFASWGVGAGLSLLGLTVGLWRVGQIRRRCNDVDLATLDPAIAGILRNFKSRRSVKLCVSDDVGVPAAVGFFHPVIIFPAGLLSQLSTEEIRVILLHELAHVRRWDDWTNLGQKIVKALFFFHPGVWWIENRLTLEREMACDDSVLAETSSPRAYASSLISFAERLRSARSLALVQSLVSRVCQMSLRVAHILEARRPERRGYWTPVLGVSAGLLALVLGAAPYAPRIVAFESQSSVSATQQIQPAELVAKNTVPVVAADVASPVTFAAMANVVKPRAIPASFHPRTAVAPRLVDVPLQIKARRIEKVKPHQPVLQQSLMMTAGAQEELPLPGTFVILQTVRYDASGSGVWTLSVWRLSGGNNVERQWESAVVLSVI